jgi:hypothetical protein
LKGTKSSSLCLPFDHAIYSLLFETDYIIFFNKIQKDDLKN